MPPSFRRSQIAIATVGAVLAVSLLAYVSFSLKGLMLLGSFGASALLLFALPDAPLSQPRSVVGGHILASSIAFACLWGLGAHWWSVGLASGLAVGLMMATRTVHPPAGSNAIIVFLAKPAAPWLLASTAGGAAALVLIAVFYHRVIGHHQYPHYWIDARRTPAA